MKPVITFWNGERFGLFAMWAYNICKGFDFGFIWASAEKKNHSTKIERYDQDIKSKGSLLTDNF